MIVNKNKSLVLLVGCLAISTFAVSGCRTSGFKKPNLAVLKFWKSPDAVAAKTPPPPARYFDPAPMLEEQVANAPESETIDLNSQRLNQRLNQTVASAADTVNTNVRSLNEFASGENLNASLTNAQKDFQTAMQDTSKASSSSIRKALESSQTTQWNDFELPADLESPKSNPRLNQSLAGLKKSIYDANGKLVDTTADVKNSIMNKLEQTKSSLPIANQFASPTKATAATPRPQSKINQFVAATTDKAKQISSLTPKNLDSSKPVLPASPPVANTFSSPFAKSAPAAASASNEQLKLVQAQVADANRQIEMLKQQLAQTINRNQPKVPSQELQAPVAQPTERLQSNPAPPQAFASTQQAPIARTAQLKTPRFGTTNYSAANYSTPDNSFAGTSPTNVLRAAGEKPQPTKTTTTGPTRAFPSTPYGKFAPDGKFGSTFSPATTQFNQPEQPPQPAASASFQTQVGSADQAMKFQASASSNFHPATAARRIKAHVSDVDIPDSILNGSGSYAPGSVHQVGQ